jgi:hypothetical protein
MSEVLRAESDCPLRLVRVTHLAQLCEHEQVFNPDC